MLNGNQTSLESHEFIRGSVNKELEKYPEDCKIKVNCIMVRSGWQYTYHAVLTAGRINQPRKSEDVVTISTVIFNSYGMTAMAMDEKYDTMKRGDNDD